MSSKELNVAIAAAKKGGKVLMKYFRKSFKVETKMDGSPVTIADKESEAVIIKTIKKTFPTHAFWGEESGKQGSADNVWIIDPLDGTKSFTRGFLDFGISIALQRKGEIIVGVMYLPAVGEMLVAKKGKGAFLGNKKISVSNNKLLADSFVYLDTNKKIWNELNLWERAIKIIREAMLIRASNGLNKLMDVATGRADAYVGIGLSPWDVAAGSLIINEAGGKLTDFEGNETILLRRCVASNGKVQNELLNILGEQK